MILTCVRILAYRLAKLGTSLRVQGKLILRKKEVIVFYKRNELLACHSRTMQK